MGWQDDTVLASPAAPAAAAVPAWQSDPVAAPPHVASGALEAIQVGYQGSATGLMLRNALPDIVLDPSHAKWYERALATGSQMVSELPEMMLGSYIGAPVGALVGGAIGSVVPGVGTAAGGTAGTVMGSGAGAFAVPSAIRTAYTQAITKGQIKDSGDFLSRAMIVLQTAGKEAAIGGLTFGAGGAVARTAGKAIAPAIGESISVPAARSVIGGAQTAAELGTMVVAPAALEGKLPEPQDFLDAAIVLGGAKGAVHIAGRLRTVYARTGTPPEQVVADAARDPSIRDDLAAAPAQGEFDLGVPKAYQPLADAETARSIVPGVKAEQVAASPFAEELPQAPGEPARPTHVNYDYINSTDDAKLALARLSDVYEAEIQKQRRGTVSWEETSAETARILNDTIGGKDPTLLMPREPGTAAGAAELLARKQMVSGAAEQMMAARDALLAKGEDATPADHLAFLASIERLSMIQSDFLGARAETGRALNILKSTAADADRVRQIQDVVAQYGGDPVKLAQMLKEVDTVQGAAKFARDATKATTWEKVVEAWKASILSGPITHAANIIGNTTFMAMRPAVDAVAATFGALRGGADRVTAMEPVARVIGDINGTLDGLKVAAAVFRSGEDVSGKAEHFRQANTGALGAVIQLPFRALSAADALFKTMNERGEAYALATREASGEGLHPLTREFRERVAALVENPPEAMQEQTKAAGLRFTFNTPLGEKGAAVQGFIKSWHLEWAAPFVRTPGNILKELVRLTPASPLVGEWRSAIKEGGAARDKALAEVAMGTSIMAATAALAFSGSLSGQGSPDPGKRRVKQSAGWQPYSIKIGDTWYSYQRLQPIGTLVGVAADMAEVWDHLTPEESDKVPKMLATAFANAVTNQTFLQGLTSIVNAMSDPTRFGPRFVQSYAASVVPAIVGQPTQMADPVVREVDSMLDAVKSRIPGLRETLLPKRDVFGEPVQTKERLGGLSPVTETTESTDKVRTEAARLDVSVADTPKKTHLGRATGKLGDVKLTPEQRDVFAEVGGKLAYDILAPIVNAPGWDDMPDMLQKRVYSKAFALAHKNAALATLPPEQRAPLLQQITEKVQAELEDE